MKICIIAVLNTIYFSVYFHDNVDSKVQGHYHDDIFKTVDRNESATYRMQYQGRLSYSL